MKTEIAGQPMSDAEALEDVAVSLADAICDGDDIKRQKRIRQLLVEFADEIKRRAIEP